MKSANPEHWDFYRRYRRRMREFPEKPRGASARFREILLAGPDLLHLSLHLMKDPDVPKAHKIKLAAAVAYFISPVDFLPEAILGPVGYLDDIAIIAYVLNALLNDVPEEVVERYWAGDDDALHIIRKIVHAADKVLGKGLWRKLTGSLPEQPGHHIPK